MEVAYEKFFGVKPGKGLDLKRILAPKLPFFAENSSEKIT
jgi:hypothetical protein